MVEGVYHWDFSWVCVLAGAVGGLVKAIASTDSFILPSFFGRQIFFASLKSVLVGAFIGFVVDTHPVFSALLGYSGSDVLQVLEAKIRRRLEKEGEKDA